MDFNAHMKNTAYLDKTADVRQMFLIEHGFPMEEILRLRNGPVVMKDEVEYHEEVGLPKSGSGSGGINSPASAGFSGGVHGHQTCAGGI